ncbi:alpha/beta hydrolase [Spongisporangium articulatum]|uniref:Alpha/beta hydrolase n=1 Tax=Spongisporangium articulatum TaxID=3362603 RepID=A0ABW8AHX4_9ACTN
MASVPQVAEGARGNRSTHLRAATYGTGVDADSAAAFRAQTLTWRPCIDEELDPGLPSAYYKELCAYLTAPLNWDDPGNGRTIRVAVSKLPATGTRTGVLFTNPGGPGASGLNLPMVFLSDGRKAITRSQDVYGMDVRGTGLSTNVTCGGVSANLLDPRDRSAVNLDLMMDGAAFQARACQAGSLTRYVNTAQTVQDLELLRRVIGAGPVNWLGYSAGTWLGARYATAYPAAVQRLVLDSNVDVTNGWEQAFELQPMGFQRRFREDFLPWAAKYDKEYRLGTTPAAVEASYESIRAGLSPDRPVDSAVLLDQLLTSAMYAKAMFPLAAMVLQDFATAIAATDAGHDATAARAYARAEQRATALVGSDSAPSSLARRPMSSDAGDAAFVAVTCNDSVWNRNRAELVQLSTAWGEQYPLLGYAAPSDPCYFWNRPSLTLPAVTGAGLPPVLMIQSEKDPATPIEGARRTAAALPGSRMVVVKGEGDHALYAGGNRCVDGVVEAYLVHGTLPADGYTCNALPDPTPESYGYTYFRRSTATATALGGTVGTRAGIPVRGTNPLLALRTLDHALHS